MLRWAVLITSVCGVVDARRASTFYHETKNNNITITWDSQIRTNMSRTNLICVFQSVVNKVIFRIRNGVEVPESLHEQFVRRVQCDKDALREGQIKLNLSTVTTDDAGNYWCKLTTAFGKTMANETFVLNITTVKTRPETHKGTTQPPVGQTWYLIGVPVVVLLGLLGLVVARLVYVKKNNQLCWRNRHVEEVEPSRGIIMMSIIEIETSESETGNGRRSLIEER
ncbi:uncharacterized protein LOC127363556 isoform X3 [Dicentrarchus labrax]|nr:uncharacterized protein LOC127363556 isoform X3 [Dicentrarchus labrax]